MTAGRRLPTLLDPVPIEWIGRQMYGESGVCAGRHRIDIERALTCFARRAEVTLLKIIHVQLRVDLGSIGLYLGDMEMLRNHWGILESVDPIIMQRHEHLELDVVGEWGFMCTFWAGIHQERP